MSVTYCPWCQYGHNWDWTEAFDKFGFGDGDGLVMTDKVAACITAAVYEVTSQAWGMHNVVITSIRRRGIEMIPTTAVVGYDDPRYYLPLDLIDWLDAHLSEDTEVSED